MTSSWGEGTGSLPPRPRRYPPLQLGLELGVLPGLGLWLLTVKAPWDGVRIAGLLACVTWTLLVLIAGSTGVLVSATSRARRTGAGLLLSLVLLLLIDFMALLSFAA